MPIFRIACALGLLLVLAPEQTTGVLKAMVGMGEQVRAEHGATAEQAATFCRNNQQACVDLARKAVTVRQ